jgi:hypothetical protein
MLVAFCSFLPFSPSWDVNVIPGDAAAILKLKVTSLGMMTPSAMAK